MKPFRDFMNEIASAEPDFIVSKPTLVNAVDEVNFDHIAIFEMINDQSVEALGRHLAILHGTTDQPVAVVVLVESTTDEI